MLTISASEEEDLLREPDLFPNPVKRISPEQTHLTPTTIENEDLSEYLPPNDKTDIPSKPINLISQSSHSSSHYYLPHSSHSSWVWDRDGNPKHQHKMNSKRKISYL